MTTDRVRRDAFVALLVVVALLLVTGLYLTFEYRPASADAFWGTGYGEVRWAHRVRLAHRLLTYPAIGLGVLVAGFGVSSRHRWAIGIPVLLIVASIAGYALPWSQLALWAVTVGSDYSGVLEAAFDDGIRFVIVDAREIGQDSYRLAVFLHVVVLPLLLGAFLFLARGVRGGASPNDAARRNHGGRRHDAGAGPPQG